MLPDKTTTAATIVATFGWWEGVVVGWIAKTLMAIAKPLTWIGKPVNEDIFKYVLKPDKIMLANIIFRLGQERHLDEQ
jgi:hypothetical protein